MLKRRIREHIMMPKIVTLIQLEQVLRQLGFCKHVIPTSHTTFAHDKGALLLLPLLTEEDRVPYVNLVMTRSTADDWDLAGRETFERMLAESMAQNSLAAPVQEVVPTAA